MAINIMYYGRVKPIFFYLRSLKQNWKGVSLIACLFLLNLSFSIQLFWWRSTDVLPFLTFSVYGEAIKSVNGTSAVLLTDYGSSTFTEEEVRMVPNERYSEVEYGTGSSLQFDVSFTQDFRQFNNRSSLQEDTNPVRAFFQIMNSHDWYCRKLYRSGGTLGCRVTGTYSPRMDGHKVVCLDPPLQVITGSIKTMKCLTLSFGVKYDISFDIGLRDANCEVLMFDADSFTHPIAEEDEYVNFFEIGLATQRIDEYIKTQDRTLQYNTYNNLAFEHGFVDRLVNVLKMDIEGNEWEILKDMANQPYLDTIGQIAVEVHGQPMIPLNETARRAWVADIEKMMLALQERGFRRVSYFDNVMSERIKEADNDDDDSEGRYSAGEVLLVNSKWYEESFRQEANEKGLKFAPL